MHEPRITIAENPGRAIGPAAQRSMIDAAADREIGGAVARRQPMHFRQVVGRPYVVVADITNPCAAGAANALIVGSTLASAVLRQIPPQNPFLSERSDQRFRVVLAPVTDDD